MIKTYCDLCGREIKNICIGAMDDTVKEINVNAKRYEICALCLHKIKTFIEKELKENNNE